MVTIKLIEKKRVKRFVRLAFEGDVALIEKYHAANGDMDGSIRHTMLRINETSKVYPLKYYKVSSENQDAGFFVTGDNFLYSFGLNLKFRTKSILTKWWALVSKELKPEFICMMNKQNTRGIDFLKKQGMVLLDEGKEVVTLKYKPCQ